MFSGDYPRLPKGLDSCAFAGVVYGMLITDRQLGRATRSGRPEGRPL